MPSDEHHVVQPQIAACKVPPLKLSAWTLSHAFDLGVEAAFSDGWTVQRGSISPRWLLRLDLAGDPGPGRVRTQDREGPTLWRPSPQLPVPLRPARYRAPVSISQVSAQCSQVLALVWLRVSLWRGARS